MSVQQTAVVAEIQRRIRDNSDGDAIETVDGVLSYREFGRRVEGFATRLATLCAPGEFIGIEAARTSGSVVAMVGALLAGRPFVFIDPRDSVDSNTTKVSSLGIRWVVRGSAPSDVPALVPAPAEWRGDTAGRHRWAPDDVALHRGSIGYAIHTSGSTGEPKCVLVRAGSLARMVGDHVRALELDTASRTLQFARLTFDGCITEILWTLTAGACLVVLGEEHLTPGAVLRGTLEKFRVTHLKTTPFALTATEPTTAMSLRHVINGGGACRQAVVRKWAAAAAFHNAYGLTETTVCNFLSRPLDPDDCTEAVPLGAVVGDCGFDVLPLTAADGDDAARSRGTRGELVITGESVAIGYLTPQGLRPFVDGDANRVYRTGDIVEVRDGEVFFVERLDRQLKVRGFRLDPGEIEAAACRLTGVAEAVVTAEPHTRADDVAEDALVCYYLGAATAREVRAHLDAVLDPYKVPSVIHQVDALPYTRNGKVDRDALRAGRRSPADTGGPVTAEDRVLDWVRRLTGVTDVRLDDNFYDIGGDSASTVVLVDVLKGLGWMEVGVRDVLRAENLRVLVDRLPGQGA
ncbi:non-ribosomal peptide synthetase [Streptomyces genisteinicus]|uniref:Non-ribosomal peptide synthetase n=1 Tax=Streptomyces genisteinicus TaxID=2768068 RepID=A0A7H0I1I1_9ACTN|nr:non-ribosomal peptide synthetase [Streptomyces genisteinicus]QNP66647.1 non-ribosomal peptide synthetase [Streptomyces genisteinicus]